MKSPWEYANATNTEHGHQVALFMWANMAANFGPNIANDPHSYTHAGFAKTQFEGKGGLGYIRWSEPLPQLKWLFAIHNQGHGDAIRGGKARAEGVKAGVPDLCLPVIPWKAPIRYGLYIELKRPKTEGKAQGKESPAQVEWQTHLRTQGYECVTCYGFEEAKKEIIAYLGIDT